MNSWAQQQGQPGLGYIFWREGEEGGAGPVAKNIGPSGSNRFARNSISQGRRRDLLRRRSSCGLLQVCRRRPVTAWAPSPGLTKPDQFACCWIVDFPFYEWNEDDKKIDFAHNPFSMPQGGLDALNGDKDPLSLKAYQYDMVCNGFEIALGLDPDASPETMVRAFEITGLTKADVEEQFGGMYRAFQFGARRTAAWRPA